MTTTTTSTHERIWSVDMLRGLVIILMALDHIRDFWSMTAFSPEDLAQTTPGWFFTRWVTHFCAPVFVFLAGTSSFLYGSKINDKGRLSRFLLSRGLWLIMIEIVVVNFSWTFALPVTMGLIVLQVIWVIGVSMIGMSALVYLDKKIILFTGLLLVVGHNLLDGITPESMGGLAGLWKVIHMRGFVPLADDGAFGLFIMYPIVPWIGLMALGYVFGNVLAEPPEERTSNILKTGSVVVVLFVVVRFLNFYGDPSPWHYQERGAFFTFMDFLNTTKYPPSLLYLLMTLGPGILLLALFEQWKGKGADILKVFGAVPFFFYIQHLFVINATSQIYHYFAYGRFINFVHVIFGLEEFPEGYVPQLWLTYLVWFLMIPLMYFMCKWYGQYKARHSYWWLKYL